MALITLTELKDHLGIAGTADDTKLQRIVDGTNELIRTITGVLYGSTENVTGEQHDYEPIFFLDNIYINSISALKLGRTNPVTVNSSDYFFNSKTGRVVISTNLLYNNTVNDFDLITVDYNHGLNTAPKDLVLATLEIATKHWNNIKSGGAEVTEERVASFMKKYDLSNDPAMEIIKSYKKHNL